MKSRIKNITAIILSMSMFFAGAVLVKAEKNTLTNNSQTAVNVLHGLGIISDSIMSDDEITRAELAEMAVRTLGYDMPKGGNTQFSDVDTSENSCAYVDTAFNLGLMNAYSEGEFHPEDKATVNEVVKAVVTILGYSNIAEQNGGYPNGYTGIATNKKILNGVSKIDNESISLADTALIIYNALEVEILEYDGNKKLETKGSTILSSYLKLYKRQGFVNANYNKTLTTEKAPYKDEVLIDSVRYKVGSTNAVGMVGFYVNFYYKDNDADEKVIVYIDRKYENSVLMIECDSIEYNDSRFSSSRIVYTGDNNKKKYVDIDTGVAVINGAMDALTKDAFDFTGYSGGFVRLYNTDNSKKYDVVEIVKYNNYIVTDVNRAEKILFLTNCASGEAITVDLENEKIGEIGYSDIVLTDKYDSDRSIDDISSNTVISLSCSFDKSSAILYIANKQITGSVDRLSVYDNYRKVVSGEYTLVVRDNLKDTINIDSDYTFYLDFMDTIAKLKSVDGITDLGYLIGIYKDDNGADAIVRIYSSADNTVNDYSVSGKLNIEIGNSTKRYPLSDFKNIIDNVSLTADDTSATDKVAQLIQYKTNISGKLTKIIIPQQTTSELSLSLDEILPEAYVNSMNFVNGKYRITGDTNILVIPDDLSEHEEFGGIESLLKSTFYKQAKLYNIDKDTNCVGAMVVYKDKKRYNPDAMGGGTLGLVKSVKEAWDKDKDEIVTEITFLYQGAERTVAFEEDEFIVNENLSNVGDPRKLKPGDAFKLVFKNTNEILFGTRAYNISAEPGSRFNSAAQSGGRSGDDYYNHGTVRHSDGEWMIVSCDNGDEIVNKLSGTRVYVYDPESKGKVAIGNTSDISAGSEILFKKNTGSYIDIIVYKGED